MYRRSSPVQLMRGEFLETALYWAGVVSVRLGAIAERRSVSIPVSGVRCESVSHASRTEFSYMRSYSALSQLYVRVYACVGVYVNVVAFW